MHQRLFASDRLARGQLRHDLLNPVSQISGFSEMVIEDRRQLGETGDLEKLDEVCSIAADLIGCIDAQLPVGSTHIEDAVSETLMFQLQSCVEPAVARILEMNLERCAFAGSEPYSEDVKRILVATESLRSILKSALDRLHAGTSLNSGAA